jgi:hypothetical protein
VARARQRGSAAIVAVVTAAGASVVASAIGWSQFGGGGEPRPWVKPADVDGQLVRLSYVDSPCQDSADIDVDESPDEVVVTVRTRTWALSCSEANELYRFEVRLSSPLRDRELLDGACALPGYADEADCRSSARAE